MNGTGLILDLTHFDEHLRFDENISGITRAERLSILNGIARKREQLNGRNLICVIVVSKTCGKYVTSNICLIYGSTVCTLSKFFVFGCRHFPLLVK